ncbi:MAG: thiamine diphosphokinase [Clostridiales bacterium]|nr:thiamine diphosphokinase [Clostridiales bacterium]
MKNIDGNFGKKENMNKRAIIVLNGKYLAESADFLDAYIICADGGYNLLKTAGIKPDIIIGDNDSAEDAESIPKDIKRINYDREKDMTDGEICVRYAIKEGFKKVTLLGALGGRQDHVETNIALAALASKLGADTIIYDKDVEIHLIDERNNCFSKKIPKNTLISIVPFSQSAHIIMTRGLKYPLIDARLNKLSSLGISNMAVQEDVEVKISKGSALIFINT